MSRFRKTTQLLGFSILALGIAAGTASAQDTRPADRQEHAATAEQMQGMHDMKGMDNMHMMSAKVDAIDPKTGLVDVTSSGMKLKLHFPPASLANVKVGDTITLHLGFSK
ncbi:MAG: hypothetical protein J0I77_22485 [Rudaea sp.]|uniref:Uncharacterized protein n=1 Tax=marine sediment metagenome TaxID=412755 RepID=X1GEY4_9ZZZZ|nr:MULTISPECIES: hypothetical protein [unclassified Rudaea]MBN8888498.1 hypothetical protein [Rudaea sp.]MBR0345249.1 hypothetical protein [Rudaea sp.]